MHGGDVYNNRIDYDFSVNINPNQAPQDLMKALADSIDNSYRYPQYDQMETRRAIASLEKVRTENVYCTNGASEAFMAIVRSIMPKQAIVLKPSFFGYYHALQSVDCKIKEYELIGDNGFSLTDDFLELITDEADIIFLANPNNPTGRVIDIGLLERIINRCDATGTALIIDECFIRLADKSKSACELVEKYTGLYVVNAFTKLFSLPGIRAGYVVSDAENIAKLCKQLPEWNLSIQASVLLEGGSEIVKNTEFVKESVEMIRQERGYLVGELCKHSRRDCTDELCKQPLVIYDSDANFLLIRSNIDLYKELLKRRILIRACNSFGEDFCDFYRLAVKDHKSNMELIKNLYEIWS